MIEQEHHHRALIAMYQSAPFQQLFSKSEMTIEQGRSEIKSVINENTFHAGGSAHGFSYFRFLDDAAYFAAASLENEYFIVTKEFKVQFKRPLFAGEIIARGMAIVLGNHIFAKSTLYQNDKILAEGEGEFSKSKVPLSKVNAYQH
jgi:uncharacterized protein (TIGR00369 family)